MVVRRPRNGLYKMGLVWRLGGIYVFESTPPTLKMLLRIVPSTIQIKNPSILSVGETLIFSPTPSGWNDQKPKPEQQWVYIHFSFHQIGEGEGASQVLLSSFHNELF
jgi:hypothetical protein